MHWGALSSELWKIFMHEVDKRPVKISHCVTSFTIFVSTYWHSEKNDFNIDRTNIFLLKIRNLIFFSKKMYSGGVCTNSEEFMKSLEGPVGAEQPHLILLQAKLDYIPDILPEFRFQRGSKLVKSAIFAIFFCFSNIPAELFILEENFCPLKFKSHRHASFPLTGRSLR